MVLVFMTSTIDIRENREVVTIDIPGAFFSRHQQGLHCHANERNISQADGKDGPKTIQEIPSRQKREESAIPTSTEGVRYSFTKSWHQSLNQWALLSTHMIPV
jgi:hypothetical protein